MTAPDMETALRNLLSRIDDHFGGVRPEHDWKEQADARAALNGVAQQPVPVAWQYRVQYDDGSWSDWMACKKTMHDTYRAMGRIGQCPAETRELAVVSSTSHREVE